MYVNTQAHFSLTALVIYPLSYSRCKEVTEVTLSVFHLMDNLASRPAIIYTDRLHNHRQRLDVTELPELITVNPQ